MSKPDPYADASLQEVEESIQHCEQERSLHGQWFYEAFHPDSGKLFTPQEMADALEMDPKAVEGLLDFGEIPWVSIKGQRYIHYFWVRDWVDENRGKGWWKTK